MKGAARRGMVVAALAATAVAASAAYGAGGGGPLLLGAAAHAGVPSHLGFYDGHKDTYLITDVSSRAQAAALHVNYAAAIGQLKRLPLQYFVAGAHAAGQLTVFGSEPGEPDYSPLWSEVIVTWKPGVKPVLLTSDNQINAAAKAGKLTAVANGIVLNAPITKVGREK